MAGIGEILSQFLGSQNAPQPTMSPEAQRLMLSPRSIAETPTQFQQPQIVEPPRRGGRIRERLSDAFGGMANIDSAAAPLSAFAQGAAGTRQFQDYRADQARKDQEAEDAALQRQFENDLAQDAERRLGTRSRFANLRDAAETERIAKGLQTGKIDPKVYGDLETRIQKYRDGLVEQFKPLLETGDPEEAKRISTMVDELVKAERKRQLRALQREGTGQKAAGTMEDPHEPQTPEDHAEIEPGEYYRHPDGSLRQKALE